MISLEGFQNAAQASHFLIRAPIGSKCRLKDISLKIILRGVRKHQYRFQNHCQEYPNYVLLIVRMMGFPTKLKNSTTIWILKAYIPNSWMA